MPEVYKKMPLLRLRVQGENGASHKAEALKRSRDDEPGGFWEYDNSNKCKSTSHELSPKN